MTPNSTMFRCNHHFHLYFFGHTCVFTSQVYIPNPSRLQSSGTGRASQLCWRFLTTFLDFPRSPDHVPVSSCSTSSHPPGTTHPWEQSQSAFILSIWLVIRYACSEKVPNLPGSIMDSLLGFTHMLRTSSDLTVCSVSCIVSIYHHYYCYYIVTVIL